MITSESFWFFLEVCLGVRHKSNDRPLQSPLYYSLRKKPLFRDAKAKALLAFLSYRTMSIGAAPGIRPATSRSAVKRSDAGLC